MTPTSDPKPLVVIVHFCRPDFHLALKWLRWARWLAQQRGAVPYEIVFFASRSTDDALIDQIRSEIRQWPTARVDVSPYDYEHPELGYAAMANVAFRGALECTERLFPGSPTLWCEADAIPMRPTWVAEIEAEYRAAGKPFMGDFHPLGAIPHMSGNAVYPPNWRQLAPGLAALPQPRPQQGWDTLCVKETLPRSHHSHRIQQVWIEPMPRMSEANAAMIHPETALFHRCKDGTLIDLLCQRMKAPSIPLGVPMARRSPVFVQRTDTKVAPRAMGTLSKPLIADGRRAEILIVSCKRDFEFVSYCLRSIERYAKGFAGVTLAVPRQEAHMFQAFSRIANVMHFTEPPGKGFLQHMIAVCRADELCPNADIIVHVDSDNLFWQPCTPEDFAPSGKCLVVREHYDLVAPRNANRLIWRDCVKAASGLVPEYDTMVRHPNVYPRHLYAHARRIVEQHTGMAFDDYVLAGKNSFPQSFCEFVLLSSLGLRDFPDAFTVVDYDHEHDCIEFGIAGRQHQYVYRPDRDKIVEGFSHAGAAKFRNDWNKIMRGVVPKFYVK